MIIAKVKNNIIIDTAVDDVVRSGWVACPAWLGIGGDITTPEPVWFIADTGTLVPNPKQFIIDCKQAFGGPANVLTLPISIQSAISLTISAIMLGNWSDVQAYITAMQSAIIAANPAVYTAIKAAAVANNIPITLP